MAGMPACFGVHQSELPRHQPQHLSVQGWLLADTVSAASCHPYLWLESRQNGTCHNINTWGF
jgi:hypothetical protein